MRKEQHELTQADIQELTIYDPQTGELLWRKPRSGIRPGTVAGTWHRFMKSQVIGVYGQTYRRSALVWLYHNGELPMWVTHIDGDHKNDRIENLKADKSAVEAKKRLDALVAGEKQSTNDA